MRQICAVLVLMCLAMGAHSESERGSPQAGFRAGESFAGKSNINAYAATWRHGWLAPRAPGQNWQWQVDIEYSLSELQAAVPDGQNYSAGRKETWVAAIAPVFRLTAPGDVGGGSQSFLEFGIGLAYFQHKSVAAYDSNEGNLGSHLQFEDRVTLGITFQRLRNLTLSYSVFHYSNANLGDANDGINLQALSLAVNF